MRPLDLLSLLRLLPSPLLSTWICRLARDAATLADDAARQAHRAEGARNEARHEAARLRAELDAAGVENGRQADLVREQSAELDRLREVETEAIVADECHVATATALEFARQEVTELRRRCNELTERAKATERHKIDACAWCIGVLGSSVGGVEGHVCDDCADLMRDGLVTVIAILSRVATRAASCPARRHSPDPLAVTCATCGVAAGVGCVPSLNALRLTQEDAETKPTTTQKAIGSGMVHMWSAGEQTNCGMTLDDWPHPDLWTNDAAEVTCPTCGTCAAL